MATPPDGASTPPPPPGGARGNRNLILAVVGVLVVAVIVIVAIVAFSGGDKKATTAANTVASSGAGSSASSTTSPADGGTGNPDAFASCGDLVKRLGSAAAKYQVKSGGSAPAGVPLPASKPSTICSADAGSTVAKFLSWNSVTKASYDAQLAQAGWKHTTVSSDPVVITLWVKPGAKYEVITFTDGTHLVGFYGPSTGG